jgi:L-iditol 2-dehydrogenase
MKAIVWDGADYPGSLAYQDYPIPVPEAGWALVRPRATGICGTDVHFLMGDTRYLVPDSNLPAVLGHEFAGEVVEVGPGVTTVKVGDRVGVEPILSCTVFGRTCPMCRIGQYHLCQSGLTHVGVPITRMIPGGFGDYSAVHETRLFRLPDHVSFEEAALLDILGCNVHAAHLGRPRPGQTAAVVGCGLLGLDMLQVLRAAGVADLIAVAKYAYQAEVALQLGAKEAVVLAEGVDPVAQVLRLTAGWGADQVYECVGGHTDAVAQSIDMCGAAGQVIMLGGASRPRPIDLQMMLLKEAQLLPSNSYSTFGRMREFQIALNLLRDGLVSHQRLVTHRFAPADYRAAFDTAIQKGAHGALKVMLVRD